MGTRVLEEVAERDLSEKGAARAGMFDVAGGVEAGHRRGGPEGGAVRVVAGEGVAVGCGKPARGAVGDVHGQSPWPAEGATSLPSGGELSYAGIRQHTNRVSRWQSEEMVVRGGGHVPGDGEALSRHHRV